MTTPANHGPNNGVNPPEDDDPFGYLYEDGQATGGGNPPAAGGYGYPGARQDHQPGVPRTSYNQVRTVGERTYGGNQGVGRPGVPPQAPYGQQQNAPQGGYGYPQQQPHYQAPEAIQAGGYQVPPQGGRPEGPRGPGQGHAQPAPQRGGSSKRGVLIAAIAVVAAVAVGIGSAVWLGQDDDKKKEQQTTAGSGQSAAPEPEKSQEETKPSPESSSSEAPKADLPHADATSTGFALTGGATIDSSVPGAKSGNGRYVALNTAGATLTWTFDAPEDRSYKLKFSYAVPGKDQRPGLTVNEQKRNDGINMANFSRAKDGEWGWTHTFSIVNLKKGQNKVTITCEQASQCNVNIAQLWLE
ncbi:carbohydrate-binding protein [Streptomyces sp. BI20]|uniref:carbohydrate-binding protein n=1 Tax=Streptomyces sp. BI20 TaxID=3403460 RepID=UPI003C78A0C9